MTLERSQDLFAEAKLQLQQARYALDAGQYGECEKLAYQASEIIAAGYLAKTGENSDADTMDMFQLFLDKVWEIGNTTGEIEKIKGVVGDVIVLREAYEPKLLHKTTKPAAEMMLTRVIAFLTVVHNLSFLVSQISNSSFSV